MHGLDYQVLLVKGDVLATDQLGIALDQDLLIHLVLPVNLLK